MNKNIRITVIIIIVVFLSGIILYPKLKPLILAKKRDKTAGGPMRQMQQKLTVSGYIIGRKN
jgi:hypothetical protein